jgi:hypothetical protein
MAQTNIRLYLKNATWHMDMTGELLPNGKLVGIDTGYAGFFSPETLVREFRTNGYGPDFTITVNAPMFGAKYANLRG